MPHNYVVLIGTARFNDKNYGKGDVISFPDDYPVKRLHKSQYMEESEWKKLHPVGLKEEPQPTPLAAKTVTMVPSAAPGGKRFVFSRDEKKA